MKTEAVRNITRPSVGRWSQERRLEFIDFRLRWDGRINRRDLMIFFGISVPQASVDIARYTELAPANLEYDKSARVYVACKTFKPVFESSAPERFLNELLLAAAGAQSLLGDAPPAAVVPSPGRPVKSPVLVALQRAMRDGRGLSIEYQSLSRSQPARREISPHVFVHDGQRWHVRAYCHLRSEFRDFVVARILRVDGQVDRAKGPEEDKAWRTKVKLVLVPHPKLPSAQRKAVELDYGMVGGEAVLQCRLAVVFYVMRHQHLQGDDGDPKVHPVVLKNRREVESLLEEDSPAGQRT